MTSVYSLRDLLVLLSRTSVRHVGAAATAAALRQECIGKRVLSPHEFDTRLAAARLTPGTNLIALFAALGYRAQGLTGALAAVTIGLAPAVVISVLVCAVYLRTPPGPGLSGAIAAASASAVAVLIWAALRFLADPLRHRPVACVALGVTIAVLHWLELPPALLLLGSAAAGALVLREPTP